jgi:hypothetical protein
VKRRMDSSDFLKNGEGVNVGFVDTYILISNGNQNYVNEIVRFSSICVESELLRVAGFSSFL